MNLFKNLFGNNKELEAALQQAEQKAEELRTRLEQMEYVLNQTKLGLDESEAEVERLTKVVGSQDKLIKMLQAKTAAPSIILTASQAKKQLNILKKEKIKHLEKILKEVPDHAQGVGAITFFVKKTKKTVTRVFKNKKEALEMLKLAKKGLIDIIA